MSAYRHVCALFHCQLSLFFDILLALCVGVTEERFIERGMSSLAGGDVADNTLVRSARQLVWRHLKGFHMKAGLRCSHLFIFAFYTLILRL